MLIVEDRSLAPVYQVWTGPSHSPSQTQGPASGADVTRSQARSTTEGTVRCGGGPWGGAMCEAGPGWPSSCEPCGPLGEGQRGSHSWWLIFH